MKIRASCALCPSGICNKHGCDYEEGISVQQISHLLVKWIKYNELSHGDFWQSFYWQRFHLSTGIPNLCPQLSQVPRKDKVEVTTAKCGDFTEMPFQKHRVQVEPTRQHLQNSTRSVLPAVFYPGKKSHTGIGGGEKRGENIPKQSVLRNYIKFPNPYTVPL